MQMSRSLSHNTGASWCLKIALLLACATSTTMLQGDQGDVNLMQSFVRPFFIGLLTPHVKGYYHAPAVFSGLLACNQGWRTGDAKAKLNKLQKNNKQSEFNTVIVNTIVPLPFYLIGLLVHNYIANKIGGAMPAESGFLGKALTATHWLIYLADMALGEIDQQQRHGDALKYIGHELLVEEDTSVIKENMPVIREIGDTVGLLGCECNHPIKMMKAGNIDELSDYLLKEYYARPENLFQESTFVAAFDTKDIDILNKILDNAIYLCTSQKNWSIARWFSGNYTVRLYEVLFGILEHYSFSIMPKELLDRFFERVTTLHYPAGAVSAKNNPIARLCTIVNKQNLSEINKYYVIETFKRLAATGISLEGVPTGKNPRECSLAWYIGLLRKYNDAVQQPKLPDDFLSNINKVTMLDFFFEIAACQCRTDVLDTIINNYPSSYTMEKAVAIAVKRRMEKAVVKYLLSPIKDKWDITKLIKNSLEKDQGSVQWFNKIDDRKESLVWFKGLTEEVKQELEEFAKNLKEKK